MEYLLNRINLQLFKHFCQFSKYINYFDHFCQQFIDLGAGQYITYSCFRFVFKCWSYKYNVYPRNVNNSSQILLKIMEKFKLCVPATKYYYTFYSSLDIWKTCTLYKVIKTILKVLKNKIGKAFIGLYDFIILT